MVSELLHDYAHEAHEIKEAHQHRDSDLPRGKKVNPMMHAIGKTGEAVLKGLPQLMLFGVAAALIGSFAVPAIQAAFSSGAAAAPTIGSVFGFSGGSFSPGTMSSSLLALPAIGAAIKAIVEFPKAMKEAEQHNDRVEGKAPQVMRGRERVNEISVEEGVTATVGATMDQAPEQQAWHPAHERAGRSWVAEKRPEGPITGAEKIAALAQAQREARSEQSF